MNAYRGIATQLYVWSQVLGAQGSSVEQSFPTVAHEVKSAGYDGLETNLSWMQDESRRGVLKESLEQHRLQLSGLYSGGKFHDRADAPRTVDTIMNLAEHAVSFGCEFINVNPDSVGRDKTDQELVIQGEYLDDLGRSLRTLGITLTCHNHTPEIRENAREFRAICAYTTPVFVGMCVDVHWVYRGGESPLPLMWEYSDRIRALHLRNSRDGVWSEDFSDGDIDYHEVHRLLQETHYDGWLTVELAYEKNTELTRSLAENALRSCAYTREVFLPPAERA